MTKSQVPFRFRDSAELTGLTWPLLAGTAPNVPRYALVAAATLLAHEHHSSIAKLVETSHFATAAALIRPLLEATTTAAWALYVPDVANVEGIFWNKTRLPKPGVMLSHLSARPELKGKLELKALMDGPGSILHKYTHGDMEQLRRRFTESGSTFDQEENTGTLLIADLLLLLAMTVYEVTKPSDATKNFLRRHADRVVGEIRLFGSVPLEQWTGWEPLPRPAVEVGNAVRR